MRSPIHAVLWETWRVTREEAAWKLALGIVGGLAMLSLSPIIATNETGRTFCVVLAMIFIVLPNLSGWLSIPRLNDERPGFPLYLLYTRPVRTAALVGLPMAYLAIVPAASYLVCALLLRTVFDYPLPLLPVAAWIAVINLVYLAIIFSTRRKVAMILGVMAVGIAWVRFARHRLHDWTDSTNLWPALFDFPLTDYALIALIGLAGFGVAVAAVARQRHGDAAAATARTSVAGWPQWLINLFQFPSPSSSATRAQLWFDLKSSGLPVLTIGVALAIASSLLIAVSVPFDGARPLAVLFAVVTPFLVLILGGNAFGIRRKQGRTYVSAFEATQPYGTAQLAALKILVRSACVLAALIAIGVSIWTSLSYLPLSWQRGIEGVVATLSGYELLALAFVAAIGVVVWVAASAVLAALRMRYSRVLNIAALLLLLFVIPLALMRMGRDPMALSGGGKFLHGTSCAAAVPMVFFTVYLFWSGFAERLLTLRYVCGAVALTGAFAAAWVTVLHAGGAQFAGMSATYVVSMLSPVLLLLTISMLVPAAFSRIRSPSGWPIDFRGNEPVMNDLELTVALAKAPSLAFAELRNRPRFWFPLLLVVLTTAGLVYWYYSIVDFEWLKETTLSKSSARMSGLGRNEKMWNAVIATLIAIPLFLALQAWYFLLAAKVTKLPQTFQHWFALTCWCSLPVLLGGIVSAILLLLADTAQVDRSVLNPLSLNDLLFHVRRGPWSALLEFLSIPAFLSWALTLIGVRAWSQRSWTFSATMFLLPSVLTFGIWVFLLSQ